jgi:hypothetical protein
VSRNRKRTGKIRDKWKSKITGNRRRTKRRIKSIKYRPGKIVQESEKSIVLGIYLDRDIEQALFRSVGPFGGINNVTTVTIT